MVATDRGFVPYIVGLGGTISPASSSERALLIAMSEAQRLGAKTRSFTGDFFRELPMYDPVALGRTPGASTLVEELRKADGIVVSSAAYHGAISGLLKNALDYTEDMSRDERIYFAGLPVGMISVAKGWQAAVNNLATLRSIMHSLRGWPTPYGCVINTDRTGVSDQDPVETRSADLALLAREVVYGAVRLGGTDDRTNVAAASGG